MVQEYVGGGTLQTLLKRQATASMRLYSWQTCARWMLQLALAVDHMHSLRPVLLIHRDIKSDNVMLTEKSRLDPGSIKLGDLGLHRQVC